MQYENRYQTRGIDTNQSGVHDELEKTVQKHLQHRFLKPIAEHSKTAFAEVATAVAHHQGPLVLDACCGVGESTLHLAQRHPEALVIGVDKSGHRLAKNTAYQSDQRGGRYLLVRADLNDFWRQALDTDWTFSHQYILYPNPWPKQKHLQRRWHGGPLFPSIVALGGVLELRSNWQLYVEEFQAALAVAGKRATIQPLAQDIAPLTPFERKYQATGQRLWQLQSNLC